MRRAAAFLAYALSLAACGRAPLEADPAIWHVTGARGEEAWLFGTIHAAPQPIAWQTAKVRDALDRAGEVMVEVANIADEAAVAQAFTALSRTPGLPPVEDRVPPERRAALQSQLAQRGFRAGDLRDMETWAVALTLARPASADQSRNGIDRAVLAAAKGKPVVELEGATRQLSIFDRLPETEQRDLLNAVLADAGTMDDDADLAATWRTGDMRRIEAETRTGLLADPELRQALFSDRNLRWSARIIAEMHAGRRPFVAVGAAHMAGPDGLVALLRQAGYHTDRVE